MMATKASIPNFLEDSKPAAIKREMMQMNVPPTQDSGLMLQKNLEEVSEKKEPGPTKLVAKGGKNALLARVQAAQERTRLAQEAKKKALIDLENARLKEEGMSKRLEEEMKEQRKQDESKEELPLNSDLFEVLNSSEHLSLTSDCAKPAAAVPPTDNTMASHAEEEDLSAFQLGPDGNVLSAEEQQQMLKEQEEILRKFEEEKIASDRAIAELSGGIEITEEEVVRMSLDRKLAEKLQNEIYMENEEEEAMEEEANKSIMDKVKSSLMGEPERAVLVKPDKQQNWGQYLSSLISGSEEIPNVPNQGSAEITISKKPMAKPNTSKVYGAQKNIYDDDRESAALLPGRVAESKPLFSCLTDQVSNMIVGQPDQMPDDVHGVDSSGLLAGPNVRKDEDGNGAYASLGLKDEL